MPKPQNPTMKVKNGKLTFKQLIHSLRPFRYGFLAAFILAIASAILGIFTPDIVGKMTNVAVNTYPELDWAKLGALALGLIILFIISSILNYIQSYIFAIISSKYAKSLREKIIDKISHLPISYFDQHKFGDTLSRMTNDIDTLAMTLGHEISDLTTSFTTLVGITVMMLTISVPLSFISFAIVPISILVVGRITSFAQKFFREQQNILGVLNSKIEEGYSGQLIIKSNSHEELSEKDFMVTNEKLAKTARKAQILSSLSMPVTHIFTNLGYVATCIVGGYHVIEGRINIGQIQAFIQYVSRFNRPITEVASTTSTIQSLLAAAERVFEFLNETEETPDPIDAKILTDVKGAVEFKNICFSYDGKNPIIKNFSASVKPGQQIAIVGPTGAGKTTLINLLMRFYDPDSGSITIDNIDTKDMNRADVRQLFGMVLQDTWLFSGTIAENLRYGNQKATENDLKKAAKASDIHHVIESLGHGYNTVINEDSDNISAGEKQLLTIARAMVANPPMIILDEATSNVDTRTEQLVQAAFEKLTKGRTSFVIAHRLSTIRNADLILVLKDGNIIEQGNHDELLKKNGFYAELYNSQFAEN